VERSPRSTCARYGSTVACPSVSDPYWCDVGVVTVDGPARQREDRRVSGHTVEPERRRGQVVAVPVLPCRALDDVLGFYEALGFEVTSRQERPNPYAATRWNCVDVHFYGDSDHAPDRGAICLLLVDEVEELHERFRRSLRASLGRVPTSGLPRITRMRPGQTRFTVVDPAGNSVLFITHGEPDPHEEIRRLAATLSPLGKAIRNAEVLRDYKNDNAACARVLRGALARFVDADAAERARAAELLADLDVDG
jgi:catechol 2,3-dioxygenase-like lactoylglutathione lyase family enzyme